MGDTVLVLGSGGREHVLCWSIARSPSVHKLYVCPGNAGTRGMANVDHVDINITMHQEVVSWCVSHNVSCVVVGPEAPLAAGLADALCAANVPCFGPSARAAEIEWSKHWSKEFMLRHQIPTANFSLHTDAQQAKHYIQECSHPVVVKACGLAAGKGVIVCETAAEGCAAVDQLKSTLEAAADTIIVEERLTGEEVSVLAFSDGTDVKLMLAAQDHKHVLEGDVGANTGGMGAYCPAPQVTPAIHNTIHHSIVQPAISGLQQEGRPFIGVLYAGLMLTSNGPKVLEFNCRFGDPEAEVIIPLLKTDLYTIIKSCCAGSLASVEMEWRTDTCAVGTVLCSGGYPGAYSKGELITGLERYVGRDDVLVFHAGTASRGGDTVTSGGRVLCVVGVSSTLSNAASQALQAAQGISFNKAFYRKDIAFKGISLEGLLHGSLTYSASGVSISAGDEFVSTISPLCSATHTPGAQAIGGFGSIFDLKAAGYVDPLLVSGTDGVGTKLILCGEYGQHSSIGIDLVAMCVNDILCHGAQPLYFLDYYATGKLEPSTAATVLQGICEGCRQANCSLTGGETAEMSGMYSGCEYDVAGFAVGAVEREKLLPRINNIAAGDVIICLPSSGLHSNGFSLVRRVVEKSKLKLTDPAPFKPDTTLGSALLTPTEIYVRRVLPVLQSGVVHAAAHITGGGLVGNIARVLPPHLQAKLNIQDIPHVYGWLAAEGGVSAQEMLKTFNLGIGMALVVSPANTDAVLSQLGGGATVIGHIHQKPTGCDSVVVNALIESLQKVTAPYIKVQASNKKRVAVLISGSGTNLQALLDSSVNNPSSCADICLVISNVADVEGLKRAEKAGVKTLVISHKGYKSRSEFDSVVSAALVSAGVEIVVLAGFMRILSAEFVQQWTGRLINIHPSLLPAFKGMHTHKQALDAGVYLSGCTVHFVNEDVDCGGIILQESVVVEAGDTVDTLQERIKMAEHKIYPRALHMVAEGKVQLGDNNKVIRS